MNEQKAVLLDLGVIDNVGYVTERPGMRESVKMHGILPISDTELLALLDYHCDPNLGILSPSTCQVVTGLEVPASMLAQGLEPAYWMSKTQFRGLHQMNSDNSAKTPITNSEDKVDTAALLAASESIDKAASIVSDSLAKKLSSRLSMPLENIDPTRPMHSFGVDSLVAKELRNWFAKEIGADVSVFEILGNESIADLGLEAVGRSRHCHHSVERTREGS